MSIDLDVDKELQGRRYEATFEIRRLGESSGWETTKEPFRADGDVDAKIKGDERHAVFVRTLGYKNVVYRFLKDMDGEEERRKEAERLGIPYNPMDLKGRVSGEFPDGGC
ncbi:MAG: hypothetical protein NUV97_00420 [archaeon]|nr:hypothetical protein [archaeon]MCR4324014.1 hypothetical protein [Nanoarchaeota archaeon]